MKQLYISFIKSSRYFSLFLTLVLSLLCVSACAKTNDNSPNATTAETLESKKTFIVIGDSRYDIQFNFSKVSEWRDEPLDYYDVITNDGAKIPGATLVINPATENISCFRNMKPYPCIQNIQSLSDEAIREAVEQQLNNFVDFSLYNTFSVQKYHPNGDLITQLCWGLKKDLLCNVELTVDIDEDGFITDYSKTDACPEDLDGSFMPPEQRKKLLEKGICKELKIKSIDQIDSYEITSEIVSLYHGKPSIIYSVKVIEDGFSTVIVVTIS